jgi:hypothetical protein
MVPLTVRGGGMAVARRMAVSVANKRMSLFLVNCQWVLSVIDTVESW